VRRLVYCTASFSICSLRRAKFPIIYPVPWLDYKVVTHPFHDANLRMCMEEITDELVDIFDRCLAQSYSRAQPAFSQVRLKSPSKSVIIFHVI
jgi:hypothetical protein